MYRKIFTSMILILTFALLASCGKGYYDLSAKQFESFVSTTKKIQIIDVRSPQEYAQGHIKGAVNIPISDTTYFASRIDAIEQKNPFAVYCHSGIRSARASEILSAKFLTVYNLKGGIVEWEEKGLEVVKD